MKKNESVFQQELNKSLKTQFDKSLSHEDRVSRRKKKIDDLFVSLGNKTNRYIFYCPDIPFANAMVKIIYEQAYKLQSLGYKVVILHDIQGFRPTWFQEEWVLKEMTVDYLIKTKKSKIKDPKPTYSFQPLDTIIIPEGFWSVMQGFYDVKQVHKVVMCFGYSGLIATEPGLDWSMLGFTDVVCISEQVKSDYEHLWPQLNYHVAPYSLKTLEQVDVIPPVLKQPTIGLSIRNREEAQMLVNIFLAKYPYLDMFSFKILKQMGTVDYLKALNECALLVFVEENAGHPMPPLEALALDVPTVLNNGRGLGHLGSQEGVYSFESRDVFVMAEDIASFCLDWLENKTQPINDKKILENYTETKSKEELGKVFNELQEHKIKLLKAIETALNEGKLEEEMFDVTEVVTETELETEIETK